MINFGAALLGMHTAFFIEKNMSLKPALVLLLMFSYPALISGQDLQQDTTEVVNLEGTVFTAEKKPVIYRLDKKTVSGSSSLSASGGSAVDVLKSMPSVRVDADGEVSFRGSTGFLVYVDGKPSMLEGTQALEQIPAENIEDIEIITSPSAVYRTDGDAGIINIITKKRHAEGLGGSVSASGSTIGTWSGDVQLSMNRGSHRWYIGGTASQIADAANSASRNTL